MKRIKNIPLILCMTLLTISCSSDTQDGDPNYLVGDMMVVEVTENVMMYFLDHGDGTVSLTYDQRNPMHITSDNKYALKDYVGEVTIPSTITFQGKTYQVTGVTECAFMNNTSLVKVNLPASVSSIGKMAFFNCSALEEANIPDGITRIPDYCFSGCKALKRVEMPSRLTGFGTDAFKSCTKMVEFTIPEGITELSESMFSGYSQLVSVSLPDGLKTIGDMCFRGCSKLVRAEIPASVERIGAKAFYGCRSEDSRGYQSAAGLLLLWLFTLDHPHTAGEPDNHRTRLFPQLHRNDRADAAQRHHYAEAAGLQRMQQAIVGNDSREHDGTG